MQAPLTGLKVIEFTRMTMGAELGADVMKVKPEGDQTQWMKGPGTGFFAIMNRNKRSELTAGG